jgi:hypothetical protein
MICHAEQKDVYERVDAPQPPPGNPTGVIKHTRAAWSYRCTQIWHVFLHFAHWLQGLFTTGPSAGCRPVQVEAGASLDVITSGGIALARANDTEHERAANRQRYLDGITTFGVWGCEAEAAMYAQVHGYQLRIWQPTTGLTGALEAYRLVVDENRAQHPSVRCIDVMQAHCHYQALFGPTQYSSSHPMKRGMVVSADAFHAINVPGDGNCLYSAMAYVLDLPGVRDAIDFAHLPDPDGMRSQALATTVGQMRQEVAQEMARAEHSQLLDVIVASELEVA